MITIEASNTYFGGGYTLLRELLLTLSTKNIATTIYVGYQAIYNELTQAELSHINVIKTDSKQTLLRYMQKSKNTLFFCSLPPFVKSENSFVYAHNPHILSRPGWTVSNIKFIIYHYWVRLFKRKVDFFACQTKSVADKLETIGCKTKLLPFYPNLQAIQLPNKQYDFCYISTLAPHKNHQKLLDAIEVLVEQRVKFNVVVTVRDNANNAHFINRVKTINQKAGWEVVVNKGFASKDDVSQIYASSSALIFPSLTESFGLPLIEAFNFGLKILASDKPFTFDIIDNPIVFNPDNAQSIATIMMKFLNGEYHQVNQKLLVEQRIDELINYLNKQDKA